MNGQPRPWEGEKLGKYEAILLKKDDINNEILYAINTDGDEVKIKRAQIPEKEEDR